MVALLTPGLLAWQDFVEVPEGAAEIEVLGKQWEWNYRLPGKDGKLGKSGVKFVNDDNFFGIDPNDPNGKDDILIEGDDLHMPMGKPIKMLLRTVDVLHDFYVPQFRAKMDWFQEWLPTLAYAIWAVLLTFCAQSCGVGHHAMRVQLSLRESAFNAWLAEQNCSTEVYENKDAMKLAAGKYYCNCNVKWWQW